MSTISSLVSMLMPIILVRILSPDEFGTYKVFFLYLTLVPALSMITGVINGLPYWAGRGETGKVAIQASSLMFMIFSLIWLVLTYLFRSQIAQYFGWSIEIATVFSFGACFAILSSFYDEAAIASGRIWAGAIYGSGFDLLKTLAILIVAYTTRSLELVVFAFIVVLGLRSMFGIILGLRHELVAFKWDPAIVRGLWKYALPVSAAWIFGLGINYSDQLILSRYVSAAEFAFYSVGCLTVPPISILEYSVTRVLIPQLTAAVNAADYVRGAALFRKAVAELCYFIFPAVAGMIIFAAPILHLLFTEQYSGAWRYLELYSLVYAVLVIPGDALARARGQSHWILWNFVSFALLTLALCLVLTFSFGAMGALIGLVLAKVTARIYTIYYIKTTTQWKYNEFLPLRESFQIVSTCVGLGLLCRLVRPLFLGDAKWFFVMGPVFSILYFAITIWWAYRDEKGSNHPKKVLMLTPSLRIGGLERMILNLSVELKSRASWDPQVIAYDHSPEWPHDQTLLPLFAKHEIPVEAFLKPPRFSFAAGIKIARKVLQERVQVIHSHDLSALIYGVTAKFLTFNRVTLVHTQHSFVHLNRKRRYRVYERFFSYFVDHLIVVSEDLKKTYIELGVKPAGLEIISNGIPLRAPVSFERKQKAFAKSSLLAQLPESLRQRLAAHQDDVWILYLARLHSGKGQDHAVDLWNKMSASSRKECVLIFVGPEAQDGQLRSLESKIGTSNDASRVIYAGATQDPHSWYEASDLFLSCSEFEGMPLGPMEAAGSGLPLALSRIPGHQPLIDLSLQFDLKDLDQGARSVEELIVQIQESPQVFLDSLTKNCHTIRSTSTVDAMTARYEDVYLKASNS